MSDATTRPPADDEELGAPVDELRDLALPPDDAFRGRVRRRIERRVLAGEMIELAWSAPLRAALELVRLPFEWFDPKPPR